MTTTTVDEQLALINPAPAPARTWADARPGERLTYQVPGSPWCGTWTVRRIEPHPASHNLLIVDLIDGTGRVWMTWRDRRVALT